MLTPPDKLTITITRTVDGLFDYVQVLSSDQFSLNIVLIAQEIVISDKRTTRKKKTR